MDMGTDMANAANMVPKEKPTSMGLGTMDSTGILGMAPMVMVARGINMGRFACFRCSPCTKG